MNQPINLEEIQINRHMKILKSKLFKRGFASRFYRLEI